MSIYSLYFGLALFFVFGMQFMVMAIRGFIKGKVYHTSGCPPIKFKEEPIKFILWSFFLIVISLGSFIGVIFTIREIMRGGS